MDRLVGISIGGLQRKYGDIRAIEIASEIGADTVDFAIDDTLNDVISLYHHSLSYNIVHVYIPLIKGYILSAISNTLPLSLKVGVMAEIFVSSAKGIGKQLYIARVNIDMVSIFAWILWMVIIILAITELSHMVVKKLNKE